MNRPSAGSARFATRYYQEYLRTEAIEIDGVVEALAELSKYVRMAIVTTAKRADFDLIHEKRQIRQFMDFVLVREDYEHAKPHPEPYLTGLKRFGATKEETLVVEDSSRGLSSAVAAGIDCAVVHNDFTRATGLLSGELPDCSSDRAEGHRLRVNEAGPDKCVDRARFSERGTGSIARDDLVVRVGVAPHFCTVKRRSSPRVADSRCVSASSALWGGRVEFSHLTAISGALLAALSFRIVQVPRTTPPTITGFALRVMASRRADGVTWVSLVPGPITHWSCPGRNRTASDGCAAVEGLDVLSARRTPWCPRRRPRPAGRQLGEPAVEPLAARAQAVAEPVVDVVDRRRPVRPEVRRDGARTGVVEVGDARSTAGCRRGAGRCAARREAARSSCRPARSAA